jgi:hypothetical protein
VTALGGGQTGNPSTSKHGFGGGTSGYTTIKELSSGLRTIYADIESSGYNEGALVATYANGSVYSAHSGLAIHKSSEYTFTDKWNNFLDPIIEVPFYNGGHHSGSQHADIRGTGGGANGRFDSFMTAQGGDGGGGDVAHLGGSFNTYYSSSYRRGGNGNLGAGGSGLGGPAGGSGAGAAGEYGQSGEIKIFEKRVPSATSTYTIVIGAGGDASRSSGGGGQGICIIRY